MRFERHGPRRASQRRSATKIAELDNVGEATEREKVFDEDRGLLWRLESNWRYEERDDGVVVEAEVISLSRRVVRGIGSPAERFVRETPRESLEGTLEAIRKALASS